MFNRVRKSNGENGCQSIELTNGSRSVITRARSNQAENKNKQQQEARASITKLQFAQSPNKITMAAQNLSISPKINWLLISSSLMILIIVVTIECHYLKRTQYHEQGVHGPKSYKFGFTGGDHKNPQERHEVSDGHGHVKGWYSFVDANGKHQVVHYEAHPKYGFKVFDHKSKAYNNGKRHYNSR